MRMHENMKGLIQAHTLMIDTSSIVTLNRSSIQYPNSYIVPNESCKSTLSFPINLHEKSQNQTFVKELLWLSANRAEDSWRVKPCKSERFIKPCNHIRKTARFRIISDSPHYTPSVVYDS